MKRIALVAEDNGHVRVVTKLIDDTLIASIDWLDGVLDSSRSWCGLQNELWYKYSPDDTYDLRPIMIDGVTIKPQGRINGEPLKPEAGMWRRVLLLLSHTAPRPDVVVLVRDLDGYPERRQGMEQVRQGLPWPFHVVLATPEPEVEAWLVAGFVAANGHERARIQALVADLSFDPTVHSHRLTSHPNDAPRDAKRVLKHLSEGDEDRQAACLTDRDVLRRRCAEARAFLDEVDERLVPLFR